MRLSTGTALYTFFIKLISNGVIRDFRLKLIRDIYIMIRINLYKHQVASSEPIIYRYTPCDFKCMLLTCNIHEIRYTLWYIILLNEVK